MVFSVAVAGASGYAGGELLRLLAAHPDFEVRTVTAHSNSGQRLVDDYRGTGIEAGQKSLTFALRFRAPDRTLTAAEASDAKLAGVQLAAARHGAHLRE